MSQTVAVEQLAERVEKLEQEIVTIKHDLAEAKSKPITNGQTGAQSLLADQRMISQAFAEFMAAEGIDVQPVGVGKFREMMRQSGLSELRMSNELIAMRDE